MNTKPHRNRIIASLQSLILIVASFLLAGCSKRTEEAFIGKWEAEGKAGVFIEFLPDNKLVMSDGNREQSGRWTKVGDDRIKAEITMMGITAATAFENIEISGDRMTLVQNGKKASLNRKK